MERRARLLLIAMLCLGCSKTPSPVNSSDSVASTEPRTATGTKVSRDSRERKLTLRGKPFRQSFDDVRSPLEKQLGFGFVGRMSDNEPYLKGQKGGWGTGLGPVVVLAGDDEGLKYINLCFDERTDSEYMTMFAWTLKTLLDAICDDSTMTCHGSQLPQRDIEAERERIIKWITGPAISALHAAESESPRHRTGDVLQTSVRAVFDGIVMRGQISPQTKGAASFTFRFTPGPCTTNDWSADE